MTTVIKFQWCESCESYHPFAYPDELEHESLSGEYVPLAKHKALETHAGLLAKEVYELKGLLRRVVEVGPALFDDEGWNRDAEMYENSQSNELFQLLLDCREVLK